MESLPEIDVVNSNPSELLASPLNITIQQNVNEDNNSSSNSQDPLETTPFEQDMIPTKYKFIIREFKNDYHTSIASKLITPYDWWLNNKVKIFSLQNNFLRPSPYDLRTEENHANFLPYQIKKAHHITYQKFLQYKEPDNYIFFNSKYTSLFTFNSEYLIDHTKTKGKLRNYDPLKQSFLFLPNDNPKRPIIVPQEYL